MKRIIFTTILFITPATYAMNDTSHKAHVHGTVDITLVAESNVIEIHITSPLMNLVGFEYQAKTVEEKKALEQMEEVFNTPHNWLKLDGTTCQLSQYSVSYGNDSEELDHNHHEHQAKVSQHAELEANYQFACNKEELNKLNVNLSDYFTGIETLELSWVVNTKSGVAVLHHGEKAVVFNP